MSGAARGELDTLAAFVHGFLAAFHLIGFIYNWRRKQWFHSSAHALGVAYDAVATCKHLAAKEQR